MNSITPDTIKKYISKGLSVFPVQLSQNGDKVEKKPVVEWTDYQRRFATEEEINIWCNLLEFNALGMATGKISGITVLDIDDPSITEYDSDVKVGTISGGFHLWYKYKPGVRNSVRVGDKLMDVRGDGGFVVVPPSALPDKKYTWIKFDFDKLTEFPVVVQHHREVKPVFDTLPEAGEGTRNETAIKVAGHMISQTKKQAWETTAWTAFRSWNEHYVTPPLAEFELRRTFDSAVRMESQKHETSGSIKIFKGTQSTEAYNRLVEKWKNGLTTGYEILDQYFTFMPEQMYLLSAPTHMGKCFGKGTKIMMFNGLIKKVEDIIDGDYLMGDDSTPRKVISCISGEEEMFIVKQKKGNNYVVNKSHILCLKQTGNKNNSRYNGVITSSRYTKGKEITIEVSDYIKKSKTFKHTHLGYKKVVNFPDREVPIDPYFLGLWLGDGNSDSQLITSEDHEIVDYLEQYAFSLGLKVSIKKQLNKCLQYNIVKNKRGNGWNLSTELRKLNLYHNKHIPDVYKINSKEKRLLLLAGLIDSDGYNTGGAYEITQKNEHLIKDIQFLSRSLGFVADYKKTRKKSQNGTIGDYYRLRLRGNCSTIPVKVERKKTIRIRKDDVLVNSIKVESIGVGKYYGFLIDGNHKFLLEDCTVVHNTTVALNIASRVASMGNNVLFCSLEQGLFIEPRVRSSLGKMPDTLSILTSDKLIKSKDLIETVSQMPDRLHLLVIDHLHFMEKDSRNGVTSAIDTMIIDLQNTAKTLEIPILIISHLRKLNEEREPTLDDLRDSSSLSQVPSVVMQLYVKKADDKVTHRDTGSVLIRKNRITGKLGRLAYQIKDSGEVVISEYVGERMITV